MSFRIRPYDPSRKRAKRTPAQEAATQRNFRVFRLRSLYTQTYLLTEPRRSAALALIDEELKSLGALTHEEHVEATIAKWAKVEIDETDLPF